MHRNIKFTVERENNKQLAFTDVLIIRENNRYTTTIYKKSPTTNLYLQFDSNQPRKYELGLIRSVYIRILRNWSNEIYLRIETNNLFQVLHKRRYSENIIKKGTDEAIEIHKKHQSKEQKPEKKITEQVYSSPSQESRRWVKRPVSCTSHDPPSVISLFLKMP